MRLILPLILLFTASACQKGFDEKYADTERQLKEEAKRLDKDMAAEAKKEPGEAK